MGTKCLVGIIATYSSFENIKMVATAACNQIRVLI
jgi:hypothetical protein